MAMTDKIVDSVIAKYQERSQIGIKKYGTTLEKNNLTLIEWLNHLQEEMMDATLYIEKLKSLIKEKENELSN
jgi:tRNA A37 threonylcarbamoyladenosine biosynthesis protein TsaE